MFNSSSYLVKLYVRKVNEKEITLEETPHLFNLYDEVERLVADE